MNNLNIQNSQKQDFGFVLPWIILCVVGGGVTVAAIVKALLIF